jgi:large subunit ribosomal protein L24
VKPLKYYKTRRRTGAPAHRRAKLHVTKGDVVMVIAGDDKGKRGKVLRALPMKQRVVVEGVNVVKRHRKARQQGEESQILSFPAPLAV